MEEMHHFRRVVGSFVGYEADALVDVERTRQAALKMKPEVVALLPDKAMQHKVASLREAIATNASFLRAVVENQGNFGPEGDEPQSPLDEDRCAPSIADFSKVRSTLHSCVRDWSDEGAAERAQSYGPLISELRRRVPAVSSDKKSRARVLVPGAGLARLVLEIAAAGYSTQGNEFSYHMLLVSNFILNANVDEQSLPIAPYVDHPSNQKRAADRTRVVRLPDVSPSQLLSRVPPEPPLDFSMAAGEFLEVYKDQSDEWDAVVTCFFLDTAPVAVEYVSAIRKMLKTGRPWINLGPLLYHWVPATSADLDVDERYAQSVELSWEELRHVIIKAGFDIVHEEYRQCHYTSNDRSMMRTQYDCLFFTAIKQPSRENTGEDANNSIS